MKKQLLILGTVAVFALAGCGKSEDKETASGAKPDAEKIVQQSCISCHGSNLEGAAGPALDKIGATLSKEDILGILKDGKSGGMPAGLIEGDEADAVAQWLSEKK